MAVDVLAVVPTMIPPEPEPEQGRKQDRNRCLVASQGEASDGVGPDRVQWLAERPYSLFGS
jgi:hypothetical protein